MRHFELALAQEGGTFVAGSHKFENFIPKRRGEKAAGAQKPAGMNIIASYFGCPDAQEDEIREESGFVPIEEAEDAVGLGEFEEADRAIDAHFAKNRAQQRQRRPSLEGLAGATLTLATIFDEQGAYAVMRVLPQAETAEGAHGAVARAAMVEAVGFLLQTSRLRRSFRSQRDRNGESCFHKLRRKSKKSSLAKILLLMIETH